MESPNSLYSNNINNTSKDGFESGDNVVIPSNFLISTKEIIARFPHNKRVGHYLLGRKLGEGSFAKVKEGLQTLTGQKVAIKVIDKKKAKEDAYVSKNMRREGKLLQMIIHPNIIQLYELMETENSYYLVTELCEGGDLMDYICARKYLSEACTRKFIRQIISAVDYLHRIGILHRDLKIENLLLDKNLNIKLIDFGLSNYTKSELCITQCGSPAYAAPELLAHKKYGCKVDVWSIGVNMYAMLTGNLPFTVEPFNIKSLYNKMMKNEMNPIPEHLSKSGEDLLRKLLNPDPVKRISLKEAMEHPWVNEGYASQLKPFPYPNKPTEDQINPTIMRYMNTNMEFSINEVTENIKSNKPSSSLATYYLLLNKVKTMLMKIEPKKTRTDTKQLTVKDLKTCTTLTTTTTTTTTNAPGTNNNTSNKPVVNTVNPQSNQVQILPSIQPAPQQQPQQPNAQSPLSRANNVKTPVTANLTVTTTIANGYTVIRSAQANGVQNNAKDINGTIIKPAERNQSPSITNNAANPTSNNTTTITTANGNTTPPSTAATTPSTTTSTSAGGSPTNMNNGNNSSNSSSTTSSSNSNPAAASAFAGAIKTLTQKYKTMHLTTSLDNNNPGNNNNNNNNNSSSLHSNQNNTSNHNHNHNNQNASSTISPTNHTTTTTNSNSANTTNFHYKTAYVQPATAQLNSSLDQTFNNITIIGEQTINTNNSESLSSSEENTSHHVNQPATQQHHTYSGKMNKANSTSNNFLNRNAPNKLPTTTTTTNANTVEWTQLIKLTTNNSSNISNASSGKTKSSDMNNNELTKNSSNNTISHHHHLHHPHHPHHPHHQHHNIQQQHNQLATDNQPGLSTLNLNASSSNSNNGHSRHSNSTSPNIHMPLIGNNNNNNNNNNTTTIASTSTSSSNASTNINNSISNRTTKSPIVKKLSSPITLPSLDTSRSTSQ